MNTVQNLPDHFVRTYDLPFNVADFCKIMRSKGLSVDKHTAADYLVANPFLFGLSDGMFVTRAAVFNGYTFSFKPTREEIESGAFFVGHRCVPFVDFEKKLNEITFAYKGLKLISTTRRFKSDLLLDHFALFGEEYALQIIATDPACSFLDIEDDDFVMPNTLEVTCFSLLPLIRDGLKYGDSLLLTVVDWDKSIISIQIRPDSLISPFMMDDTPMAEWNKVLESSLLDTFDRLGPASSIEEQLSNVFFEQRNALDKIGCGSIEEFLTTSEKVDFEYYGVETRLWKAGEVVPAVGEWNFIESDDKERGEPAFFYFPEAVFDCYIIDEVLNNGSSIDSLIKKMYPKEMKIGTAELFVLKTLLRHRTAILKKRYNKFSDFDAIGIRHRVLSLFRDVYEMMFRIDYAKCDLKKMPQQELVVLSQLYAHLTAFMQSLAMFSEKIDDLDMLEASIEGMEYNFDDIIDILNDAVARQHNNSYAII